MKELENLLNHLIQMWWKPFGQSRCLSIEHLNNYYFELNCGNVWLGKSLRELVSIDSWLWQFVCVNELLADKDFPNYYQDTSGLRNRSIDNDWYYRIMRISCIKEENLKDFLLNHIAVSTSWSTDAFILYMVL